MKTRIVISALTILSFFSIHQVKSQSPGLIVRPAGGSGVSLLNPNGDGYSSATTAGYVANDIAESEIPYKVVPVAITEPTGDLATGPSAGFTDIVTSVDGSGFYIYKDATYIYFRLRIGGIISGSKGYSVLIDTDNKMGGSGSYADPNYVAPSGNSPGNPGFEYEVVLRTNFDVSVYPIDGTATPGAPVTYPIATHSQISVAASTDNNNADYFYDWLVPVSAIGNPSSIRFAVTTVTSPTSALQGSRSDIYGIDDSKFTSTSTAWTTAVNAQQPTNLSSFSVATESCTNPPAITSSIATGSNILVSGTWTRLSTEKPSSATITLYKNGVLVNTTSVNTGNSWSINVPTVSNGDVFYATAQSTGEAACLPSNSRTATSCSVLPTAPTISCGSLKGIAGTMPTTASGNTILVYQLPTTAASPFTTLVSTVSNLTYPTATSFAYYQSTCSGGTNNVTSGEYMVLTQNGSCLSRPTFVCINSGSSGAPPPLASNAIAITGIIYPFHSSIQGTGAASGQILRLFINGVYISSVAATGSAFTFSSLTLKANDQIQVFAQTPGSCITQSSVFTVNCFLEPPVISTNKSGNILAGSTLISGTASAPGGSVQLYKGTSPSGTTVGSPVTVASNGSWQVTVPATLSSESYYAVLTANGCTSVASAAATVLAPSACPTITGTYTDASTTVSGTLPASFSGTVRLYVDGALAGSQVVSSATSWSISVPAKTLYYNAVLTSTAQAAGATESIGCNTVLVGCASAAAPVINPLNATINVNQNVTFDVSNVVANTWYAVADNTGKSYATSQYRSTTSTFQITTGNFTGAGTYNLRISADALTGCPQSFTAATILVNATLPVTLLQFGGNYRDARISLNWSTADEKNFSHFEVERSDDAALFTKAGQVASLSSAASRKNYQFELLETLVRPVYFRLKMVDIDGKFEYSRTLRLTPEKQLSQAKAFPNPFRESLTIEYQAGQNQALRIELLNLQGQKLCEMSVSVNRGSHIISLNGLDPLPSGTYFVRINDSNTGSFEVIKLRKQ